MSKWKQKRTSPFKDGRDVVLVHAFSVSCSVYIILIFKLVLYRKARESTQVGGWHSTKVWNTNSVPQPYSALDCLPSLLAPYLQLKGYKDAALRKELSHTPSNMASTCSILNEYIPKLLQ